MMLSAQIWNRDLHQTSFNCARARHYVELSKHARGMPFHEVAEGHRHIIYLE